jgi:2-polyprenyl-3-methyl-5-hydroxy-6-metoxy-1,4-benzoquinol methylase
MGKNMPPLSNQSYNSFFYDSHVDEALKSAREVVPLIIELIDPKSVIDIGCGRGAWLKVFKEMGVSKIRGIDGNWVKAKDLLIAKGEFAAADLNKPLDIDEKFELVVSLEVAEHLPCGCAEQFVESLVNCGPVIVFSAAIPFQWGANHVNEQWPEYWAKLFRKKGYHPVDCVRKKIWDNKNVEYYYAQNTLIYATKDAIYQNEKLLREFEKGDCEVMPLVHPRKYLLLAKNMNKLVRLMPHPLLIRIRKHFKQE